MHFIIVTMGRTVASWSPSGEKFAFCCLCQLSCLLKLPIEKLVFSFLSNVRIDRRASDLSYLFQVQNFRSWQFGEVDFLGFWISGRNLSYWDTSSCFGFDAFMPWGNSLTKLTVVTTQKSMKEKNQQMEQCHFSFRLLHMHW